MFTVETFTAPTYWASLFFNGDSSGMESEEIQAAEEFLKRIGLGDPVDCEEAGFMRYHNACHVYPLAADCSNYMFLRYVKYPDVSTPRKLPRKITVKRA
jgi:hypothetical protein